jgi:hypothetical protein
MNRFLTWLGCKLFPEEPKVESMLRQATRRRKPPPKRTEPAMQKSPDPALVDFDSELGGRIHDGGPGKNVLVRNKYVREDSGTHDTLKIIDDSLVEETDDYADDPYNTGRFDRSQSWNLRTKK